MSDPILPNDVYGHTVSMTSDGVTDTYLVGEALSFAFATGTTQDAAYLSMAIQIKISMLKQAIQDYAFGKYDEKTRIGFISLYQLAQSQLHLNQMAYIQQLGTWAKSILTYAGSVVTAVSALTTPQAVADYQWNIEAHISADPQISLITAAMIPN